MDLAAELRKQSIEEEQQLRALIPQDGFLGHYMAYTDKQESPDSYHFWVGLTTLSAVMQRRIWVHRGIFDLFPNLFTVLIGPSGRCRKSRAISMGYELTTALPFVNLMADKTSPEAFIEAMAYGTQNVGKKQQGTQGIDSTGFASIGELSVFLNKQTYSSGIVSLLTHLYDSPSNFDYVLRRGKIRLTNVCLSLLGASTPEWLATNLPIAAFEGGFMSRIIFVVKYERNRSIPWPQDPDPNEKQELINELNMLRHQLIGEITLSPTAKKWFTDWYHRAEQIVVSDQNLMGFVERKPDTLLKVAMLLAVSDSRIVIDEADLRLAFLVLNWTQERMFRAFLHVNLSEMGQLQYEILEFLRVNNGQATRTDILRKVSTKLGSTADFEKLMRLLQDAQHVAVTTEKGKKAYKLL